jgi:hypothetical protein
MIEYRLQTIDDSLRAAYCDFLPEQNAVNANGKLDWKFERQPFGRSVAVVAHLDDEIVGLNTYMPTSMTLARGAHQVLAFQSMDSVVAKKARGQGVFANLMHHFNVNAPAIGGQFVWGFPNALSSPVLFGPKVGWKHHGSAPFLIKPLRAGYFCRKLGLDLDFPISAVRDENYPTLPRFDETTDAIWCATSDAVGCAVARIHGFMNWRLVDHPTSRYRVAYCGDPATAFVATHLADKHGGRIGYVMEALGGPELPVLLRSELASLRNEGAELALAWCFPWSPNYKAYRAAGFVPFPERFRPLVINFGALGLTDKAPEAMNAKAWYVSYLDSDTV